MKIRFIYNHEVRLPKGMISGFNRLEIKGTCRFYSVSKREYLLTNQGEIDRRINFGEMNNTAVNENLNNKLIKIANYKVDSNSKKIKKVMNRLYKERNEELKANKIKLSNLGGGYKSYSNICVLGYTSNLLDSTDLSIALKDLLYSKFDSDRIYSILFLLEYSTDEGANIKTALSSITISKDISIKLVVNRILPAFRKRMKEYNIADEDCKVIACWREWISDDDYNNLISKKERIEVMEEVLKEEAKRYLNKQNKLDDVMKFMKFANIDNYTKEFPYFNSYECLEKINILDLKDFINNKIDSLKNIKIDVCKSMDFKDDQIIYFVIHKDENHRVICQADLKSWKNVLHLWNSKKYPYVKWNDKLISLDSILGKEYFIRELEDFRFHIEEGVVRFWEKLYNFQDMVLPFSDRKHNTKIGAIDLETMTADHRREGVGRQTVYAGAVALNNGYYRDYFLNSNNEEDITKKGLDLIQLLFDDLFDYIAEDKKNRNGYTIYAHNLGRFDSIFILKALGKNGKYNLRGVWKDNDLLTLKVEDKDRKLNVKLKDSLKLVPTSLNKMLKTFDCNINKGLFPHKFVNRKTLKYVGQKPHITCYFDDFNLNEINSEIYNNLPELFDLKKECLMYLKSDVLGLLEAMNKISIHYFTKFSVNITSFCTLPGLALAIFARFKDDDISIKMTKGPIENFIRQAYFGGNSNIFLNNKEDIKGERVIEKGYHYDMNSQFPSGMKRSMPTGNPVFSNNKDLGYYKLGFVFAKITPPSEKTLSNLFLQKRHEDYTVSCPREEFYEYISTVDLRQGIESGYTAEIFCGVNFPDACNEEKLFGKFVDTFYEIKNNASDPVEKQTAKLILNSVYGKFGQRESEYNIKLVDNKELVRTGEKYQFNFLGCLSNEISLIRVGPKLNNKLRRLYQIQSTFLGDDGEGIELTKARGIPSAVQISAIISAHARASVNNLKNIEGNLAIASNTDSLILRKPLPDNIIGNDLGQWKLEHRFKDGIFIKPKLYCYWDSDKNELIKKASGVNSGKLTYSDYLELSNGHDIRTDNLVFSVRWDTLHVDIKNVTTKIKGTPSAKED